MDANSTQTLLALGAILLLGIVGTIVNIVISRRPPSKLPK